MELQYLDFDYSEDEAGQGTWDAMASVPQARWSDLLAEVAQLLHWASHDFAGRQAPLEDGGDWDFDLSAQDDDNGCPLRLRWDRASRAITGDAPQPGGYTTLTLTLTGTAHFGDALRASFGLD